MNGTSVAPPGTVPGRIYGRDQIKPYPDYGPAWVAACYGITPDRAARELAAAAKARNEYDLLDIEPTADAVIVAWSQAVGGPATEFGYLD